MNTDRLLYTSICITEKRWKKFVTCAHLLGIDHHTLFSVLCYKGAVVICKKIKTFKNVKYQRRGDGYLKQNIYLSSVDKEFIHAKRFSAKISVSCIFRFAMDRFLDEILEKGINYMEIAHLRIMEKNSSREKTYCIHNYQFTIDKSHNFKSLITKTMIQKE
jgi:hypothetical protein